MLITALFILNCTKSGKKNRFVFAVVHCILLFFQWQKCVQMKVTARLREAFDKWHMFKVGQDRYM